MADANLYTLMLGRMQPYRRTVTYNAGKKSEKQAQIVFEPGVDVELTTEELDQCQDLVDVQIIVPANRDAKGRLRVSRELEAANGEAAELKARVAELEAENAELRAMIEGDGSEESEA